MHGLYSTGGVPAAAPFPQRQRSSFHAGMPAYSAAWFAPQGSSFGSGGPPPPPPSLMAALPPPVEPVRLPDPHPPAPSEPSSILRAAAREAIKQINSEIAEQQETIDDVRDELRNIQRALAAISSVVRRGGVVGEGCDLHSRLFEGTPRLCGR